VIYVPQYISQKEYDSIVNAPHERGNGQGLHRNTNRTAVVGNVDCDETGNVK
jgi:hypothetical protein